MGKNAVCYLDLSGTLPLKKCALFFDKIFIDEIDFNLKKMAHQYSSQKIEYKILAEIEFLLKWNIVDTLKPYYLLTYSDTITPEFIESVDQTLGLYDETDYSAANTEDHNARINAAFQSRLFGNEYYPILKSSHNLYSQKRKDEVVQFILNDIPSPDENTSWENIIEFRSDPDVRNRYLALINWINKTSTSSLTMNDIKDEYEYLYDEYIRAFKLHKMKYHNSTLEIIVSSGIDLILSLATGQLISAAKNLFQIRSTKISLLQEEQNLPGKEIAYIYHTNQTFANR